jgi:RHS repeat-associated protein
VHSLNYDSANRLSSWQLNGGAATTYNYDLNGNRTGQTSYDAQDRQTTWNSWDFLWNNDGEFLLDRYPSGGYYYYNGNYYYYYQYSAQIDVLGNLRAFHDDIYNSVNATYVVDGLDRRVARYSYGTFQEGFLYDERGRVAAQLDSNGALKAQFVYVTKANAPDLMIDASGVVYRIVSDQVGSVRQVVKIANGHTVMQRVDYDPWGAPTPVIGWLFQPFTFAGGIYDPATGLVRLGARDYDPYRGRWFSKDRSRFAGGPNLYLYCNNDPTNCVDPTGYAPNLVPGAPGRRVWRCLTITPVGDLLGLFACLEGQPPARFENCQGRSSFQAQDMCCRAECGAPPDVPAICPVDWPTRARWDGFKDFAAEQMQKARNDRCTEACNDWVIGIDRAWWDQ